MVDESHVSLPQLKAMHAADQRRKHSLVAHGFRLPSALDNRPLTRGEFWERVPSAVLVSATPGKAERALCAADDEFCAADDASPRLAEMVLRPTGITDPTIVVRPRGPQLDDVLEQAAARAARGERTLVTALTKVAAERLATHFEDRGLRASYMHSDTTSLDRMRILKKLRQGELQVLVGVNLLREGLDLPEVSLVAVLDADKEGFLRSEAALLQMIGRAARHVNGTAVLYADGVTRSMRAAIRETDARRAKQLAHNAEVGLAPTPARSVAAENLLLNILEAKSGGGGGGGGGGGKRRERKPKVAATSSAAAEDAGAYDL